LLGLTLGEEEGKWDRRGRKSGGEGGREVGGRWRGGGGGKTAN